MSFARCLAVAVALIALVLGTAAPTVAATIDWHQAGLQVRVLNPGAKHLDCICTQATLARLFPETAAAGMHEVVGVYHRGAQVTFLAVSDACFASWDDERSAVLERLCHEKAHRADDLYEGDLPSELRDTVGGSAALSTAHCGASQADCASSVAPAATAAQPAWVRPGMQVRVLNPGARYCDTIVTRDTFNHLFPASVWFHEGAIVGMYNRDTKTTCIVVSTHTFAAWTPEMSALCERCCHLKAHRADELYDGDMWSELRDCSAPGLALDTHHFGKEQQNAKAAHTGMIVDALAPAPLLAMQDRH